MLHSTRIKKVLRLKWVAGGALALAMVAAACGDDDNNTILGPSTLDGGPDGLTGDETSPNPQGEGGADAGDGGVDGEIPHDAAGIFDAPGDDAEAAVRQDAAKIEAGAPCAAANQCDCDNDGYEAEGGACNGTDCDDRDGLRHPNQTFVVEPPDPGSDGNWDCKNPIEKQYLDGLVCSGLIGCPPAQGFATVVPCGVEADFIQCKAALLGLGCGPEVIGKRRQGCK